MNDNHINKRVKRARAIAAAGGHKSSLRLGQGTQCHFLFDAGDVQANGFQIVEDEQPGKTFSETGASYMGFAVSALMATDVHGLKIQCRRRLITNDLNCFKNRNQLIIHLSFYRCANIIRHQKNY
jgi:hypothetical protein